jgi:dephospho-CoA kinase
MGAPARPLRIGLTGGIASGKTTAARYFAARGIPVIDADELARLVVEPGQPALEAVVREFGRGVLDADGRLDRRGLRQTVFADPDRRRRLEQILHPAIRGEMARQAAAAAGPYVILAIPLLVESGRATPVDRVLVVDCPAALQRERLLQRDAETPERAEAMLAAQAPREQRLAAADDVIVNDGTLAQLEAAVDRLDRRYRALAAAR